MCSASLPLSLSSCQDSSSSSHSKNKNKNNNVMLSLFSEILAFLNPSRNHGRHHHHELLKFSNNSNNNVILVVLTFFMLIFIVMINAQGSPFADLQGEYCKRRIGGCCPGRFDNCGTPILGTFCYCDAFCNRTDNPDCCPDYYSFCLGIITPTPPPDQLHKAPCSYEGRYYPHGKTLKINCNQCKCESNPGNPKLPSEFLCEKDSCMIDPNLIEIINRGEYTWKASNYTDFWGRKLSDGLIYKLGTLEPHRAVKSMEPVKHIYEESHLPHTFDARSIWPGLIHRITDQQWCGSDWAMTTAVITADRLAIQSKGIETIQLSTQHLLSCNNRGQQGCTGGHLDRAWNFMRRFGVVDEECYPYKSGSTGETGKCIISRKFKSLLDIVECRSSNTIHGRTELYRSQPTYRISSKENDIKYEIMTYGPVQAVMAVSSDFFMYQNGIYSKTGFRPDERIGYHSVRIIGWGEEFVGGRMTKYWLVANTWGERWGDRGYFKIRRGENECEIETFVIAAWARPANQVSIKSKKFWERNII